MADDNVIPGTPGPATPTLDEPNKPVPPLPPMPSQDGPANVTPTGASLKEPKTVNAQQGEDLTTSIGVPLRDTSHSLKAGDRGPTLLQDHHLREKIMHFDHERIPERVVHARGAAAHGVFESYGSGADITRAAFLQKRVETPVFVRFSTVLGSRGSMDTARDTRGFATKFYTDEGNFDLVGNNMPVSFIQDGIKFPDIIHAAKPHPDREIPQAQSAHDTFWDFVSLHTEATHHTLWNMSDRGIPRSYRTMEGFGVHTFRLINAKNETVLVKFHWKPKQGVHSLTWEEAQMLGGVDPDFHRRDLYDSIEAGAFPQWELGVQVFPDTPEEMFEGIDLLDPTKLVPEELAAVQPLGLLTLNRNPINFFAEVEQVAFHTGHLVPGIDGTNDPLLQARNFSYLDTQLTRLGGPNFNHIPINRPVAPVNDMLRDGFHQHAVHGGVAPYKPNSLDAGNPFEVKDESQPAMIEVATPVEGVKVRANPVSFEDHFTQARLFWQSMTPVEKDHIIQAYTFELGKCYELTIKERELQVLANIDPVLCSEVATGLGLVAPEPTVDLVDVAASTALSQIGQTWPLDGRTVGIVVGDDATEDDVEVIRSEAFARNMLPLIIHKVGGMFGAIPVQRTLLTTKSVEFDSVIVVGTPAPGADALEPRDAKADLTSAFSSAVDPRVAAMLWEAYRHAKGIGVVGADVQVLQAAGVPAESAGVYVAADAGQVATTVFEAMASHRVWQRFAPSISA